MGKRAIRIIAVILYIIAVAALCVILYAAPKIQGFGMQTEIVEYTDLPVKATVSGVFVRTETLYLAAATGKPEYLETEGTKVRRGTQVFWVDESAPAPTVASEHPAIDAVLAAAGADAQVSEGGIATMTAIVSYYADGYERRISPETMHSLSPDILETLPADSVSLTRSWVRAGEPVYKFTDNNLWYFVFWVTPAGGAAEAAAGASADVANAEATDADASADAAGAEATEAQASADAMDAEPDPAIANYTLGRVVDLDLVTTRVKATVESVEPSGGGWRVILRSDMYYKDLPLHRTREVTVIFAEYSGAVVSVSAVLERDGQNGVFVKQQSGTWKWVPVQILRESDGKYLIAVESFFNEAQEKVLTINYYDEVMSDPAEEGYE